MSQDDGRRPVRVGIVGAGFGGLGMGIRLKQEGFDDFTIFERGDSVGGVWRANSYPGAACDVPSHAYSFSFAPGHHWTRRYAPRADIMRYLEDLADDFGLRPHLRLGVEAEAAAFDPDEGTWTLRTAAGEEHRFEALVTACGQLTNPAWPSLEGIDHFSGPVFHSADWDHEVELAGKRVAVVGTGASAIQIVPEIAEQTERVDIYQRTAPWILPKPDRDYPEWERKLFERLPGRVAASRAGMLTLIEGATHGLTGDDWVMKPLRWVANQARERALGGDPELLGKTTPDYEMGCKRVLFTSDWYPALLREDVELVDRPIARVTEGGIVDSEGTERPADVIVYGTGFRSHDFVAPMEITGLDGRDLDAVWSERPEAYLGTTISGFPNLYVLYGPNTNHGAASVPYTLECQFNYAIDAIRRLRDGHRYLDLRPEAQAAWRAEIDERSEPSVWLQGGCSNWYIDETGINTNNWPGGWFEFKRRTERITPADYELVG